MPKRKAVGPADSSDGEEEEYYSFPATPIQSPFPKSASNNFNLPSQKTAIPATTSSSSFSFGGGPGAKRPVLGKPPLFSVNKSQASPATHVVETKSTSSNSASSSSNQDFSKSMRDLNNAFHNSVRNAMVKSPTHSLLPLVKDYLFHSRVLLEQCRKGGAQTVNGINLPPKNFKSLGEFFDDFESRYVENNQGEKGVEKTTGSINSALNSNYPPSATETSSKVNFKSTFSTMSPAKPSDNTNTTSSANSETISIKLNSPTTNPLSSANKTVTTENSGASGFFSSAKSSGPTSLQTSAATSTSSKPSTETAPPVSKPATAAPFSGFSFFTPPAPSTSLALGSFPTTTTTPAANSEEKKDDEEAEDDEPPKVEVVQVKEDDAVYSIRCKVFGVVDGKPKDKGIGMLYVKKLEDGRYQIVVRADNNLGTVILNILLQKSLPLEKNGKNSIMTVDLQANDKKGMPIFIRVKTENDALELLAKLKEFQQRS